MTRHFFAFLALLSGLAVLGTPAHASVLSEVTCDIGASADAREDKAGAPSEVREADTRRRVRCRTVTVPRRVLLPQVLRVPVAMGIERAFE
ncbi:hypothetical protein [Erythrobacter sp. JK5]|uniref:hypothetical protein n=1 Tax=Erythrobacter sp. JK5 TaxID=2829500 RepID=UPI001BA7F1D6|nr:hypothetical protein [Erythrobacter sp. JK5]QUL38901.1 hypothetical protein KDC96_05970 [Erythrobacter sp. JK5]